MKSARHSVSRLQRVAILLFAGIVGGTSAAAQTVGVVVDNETKRAVVFNADTDTVLGSVSIPGSPPAIGDCSITSDQTLGFVTDIVNRQVWVIDLQTLSLAAGGTNPIPLPSLGSDTSITPDGKYLVVCDGSGLAPITVIDIATDAVVSTLALPADCNSVDVCSNGSVLATSSVTGNIYRLTIDSGGNLTNTGEVLFSGGTGNTNGPNNVVCAPGGGSGFVVRRTPREIRSFTLPGPTLVSTRALSGNSSTGISGLINPAGDRAFARSNGSGGAVDVFTYNSTTAELGATPLATIPIFGTITFFGTDQMAIHPTGSKLYVPQFGNLRVFDANTAAPLTSITNTAISLPTGVCFPTEKIKVVNPAKIDLKPGGNPNCVNPRSRGNVPVAIYGASDFAVADIDQSTLNFGGAPALRCHFDDAPMEGPTSVFTTDGFRDLLCHFSTEAVTWPARGSDHGTVELTASLKDGTGIQGSDIAALPGEETCEAGTPLPVP